jgi:hypothetical protein
MVRKVAPDGRPCRKCRDVQERLERDGLAAAIDRVAVADERDPGGEGWRLARRHGVDTAPFFIVEDAHGTRIFTVFRQFVRQVLEAGPDRTADPLPETADRDEVDALGNL